MSAPRRRPGGPGCVRPTGGGQVRRLREERLATAWAWEGTHARTVRLLTLDA
jgi:hypothetical protein